MFAKYVQTKYVPITEAYNALTKVIEGKELTHNDRLMLYRFRDKLTDSEKFEFTVNQQFSRIQLKNQKDLVEFKLNTRQCIELPMGFKLVPVQITNWSLYYNDKLYLGELDTKLARRVAYDINVAIGIKASKT